MKKTLPALFALSIFSTAAFAAGATFTRTAAPAVVTFKGNGPAGFKIEGKSDAVNIKHDDKAFTIIIPLKGLTTGIALRDNHMHEKYLEDAKYPDAVLEVPAASLKVPAPGATVDTDTKGMMTLHGKTKEVPFKYHAVCKADGICDATGNIALNVNDFGIVIPSYLGVTMKPDITVETAFQVKR